MNEIRQVLNSNGVSFFNLRPHQIGLLVSDINSSLGNNAYGIDELRADLQKVNLSVDDLDLAKILKELKKVNEAQVAQQQRDAHIASMKASYGDVYDCRGFILPRLKNATNNTLEFFEQRFTPKQVEWMQAAGLSDDFSQSLMSLGRYSMHVSRRDGERAFNPNDDLFSIPAFYLMNVHVPSIELINEMSLNGKIKTENLVGWLNKIAEHLSKGVESLNIEPSVLSGEYVEPKDFIPIYTGVLLEVLLEVGIHKITTDSGDSLGFVHKDLTEEHTTEAGRKIPLYYVTNLAGHSGNASAWANHMTISADSLSRLELENREYRLWHDLTESGKITWPSFQENPSVIRQWIYMKVFGSRELSEALEIDKEERLNEEKWHSDFTAYGIASVGNNMAFSPFMQDEMITWATSMMKPSVGNGELFVDAMNALEAKEDKFKLALDFSEVQALTASMITSPCSTITLCRSVAGVAFPLERGSYYPTEMNKISTQVAKIMSKELLGSETVDPREWQGFLERKMKTEGTVESFDKEIKEAAKRVYDRNFLTLEEMDRTIPNWREEASKLTKFLVTT